MNTRSFALTFGTAALLVQGVAFGQAADRPWYVGVSQDFTRESNVLGTSTDEISDTVSTTSLRGGVNLLLGRQRMRANARLSHERFKELSERDNNGYAVGVLLDWSTIERLSGTLALNSQRQQTDFSIGGITPVSLSNIERSDDLDFTARLGVVTALSFEAGIGHRQVSFSAPEFAAREYKQDRAHAGVVYRPSGLLTLSTGVSGAETRYRAPEVGQTEADRSKRRDVYVGAVWDPSGASTVTARLNFGKLEYDRATASDFDGVTGSLAWAWRPTGLLAVTTTLARDVGQEAGFVRPTEDTVTTATDFSRITNRIGIAATYELTGKVGLTGGLSYARRTFADGFTGATGRENSTVASLGARWAATRTIALGCHVSRESRSASGTGSSDMDNDRVGCFGSLTVD